MAKKMNKRGTFLDWFYIIVILFIFGVVLIVSTLLVSKMNDTNIFRDVDVAQSTIDSSYSTLLMMDNMVLFVLVGLSIFVLVSAAFVYNHPAFFFVGVFLLMIAVTVAAIASNTYWSFTNNPSILTTAQLYPKTTFILEKLPFYIAFMGLTTALVMYVAYQRQ